MPVHAIQETLLFISCPYIVSMIELTSSTSSVPPLNVKLLTTLERE